MTKKDRIEELVELLNKAGRAYYQESHEIMSNYEYDALYDELVALEKETGIVRANSPTINVGYEVLSELPKETHEKPMLSLDKTKEIAESVAYAFNLISLEDNFTETLNYVSLNEEIATIDESGVITGKRVGTTRVNAT